MVDDDEWICPLGGQIDWLHPWVGLLFPLFGLRWCSAYCLCLTNHHTVLGHRKIIHFLVEPSRKLPSIGFAFNPMIECSLSNNGGLCNLLNPQAISCIVLAWPTDNQQIPFLFEILNTWLSCEWITLPHPFWFKFTRIDSPSLEGFPMLVFWVLRYRSRPRECRVYLPWFFLRSRLSHRWTVETFEEERR